MVNLIFAPYNVFAAAERLDGHDEPGRAVAALRRCFLDEGALYLSRATVV